MKPILKWAGGKQRLLRYLKPLLPAQMRGTYYEPFLGGGAMFFDLCPNQAVLSDLNADLINFYQQIQKSVDLAAQEVIWASTLPYEKARDRFNTRSHSSARHAGLFFVLNKTCFNGLWRVNRKGEMNVPAGTGAIDTSKTKLELHLASSYLRGAKILHAPYQDAIKNAKRGDFVFMDPPYYSDGGGFTAYTAGFFSSNHHAGLQETLLDLDARGVRFMLTNSDTPFTRALYYRWDVRTMQAPRSINSAGAKRGKVSELIVRNYT